MSLSIIRRILNKLRNPSHFVGRDLEGNKYFEYPNPNDNFGRQKRVVKYRRGQDMWTYIAGDKRLPVQWTSWLTHTRIHPPTLEELHADLVRQERIRQRVALLEATEMDTIRSDSGDSTSLPNSRDMQTVDTATTKGQPVGDHQEALPDVEKSSPELVFPSQSLPSDEPEAWVPRTQRRSS